MKSIALIVDSRSWCWGHQAAAIQKYAPPGVAVYTLTQTEFSEQHRDMLSGKSSECPFDAILHFSWPELPSRLPVRTVTVLAHHGAEHEPWTEDEKLNGTGHWPAVAASRIRNRTNFRHLARRVDGIICVNRNLHRFAQSEVPTDSVFLPAGVDLEVFRCLSRPLAHKGKLRVGWCGQVTPGVPNTKGFDWVLVPLIQRLEDSVEWVINGRDHMQALTQEQMVDWYNSIDVLVCTSISEGTPSPVLEAMACGRPVVAPPIGDVISSEYVWIVPGYQNPSSAKITASRMVEGIHFIAANLHGIEDSPRTTIIRTRDWKTLAPQWIEYVLGGPV